MAPSVGREGCGKRHRRERGDDEVHLALSVEQNKENNFV